MAPRSAVVVVLALLAMTAGCGDSGDKGVDGDRGGPAAPSCGGERPPRPTGGTYTCTFTDDFDGSELDPGRWLPQRTTLAGMTTADRSCYLDGPENISVSDGAVHLTARRGLQPFVCTSPLGSFTTGSTVATITTSTHFSQTYGRFEFRARFPQATGPGVHSALWLYPQQHTYGPWPHSGEIDVAEWMSNSPDHVYPSLHYAGEPTPAGTGFGCVVSDPWSYHQYAAEWTPTYVRFLYDGQECFRHSWTPAPPLVAPQPFDQPFYLVLTQVFGSGGNTATATTPSSTTMDVDWVRAWG